MKQHKSELINNGSIAKKPAFRLFFILALVLTVSSGICQEPIEKIIAVEEATEQVYFYALERDGRISGLTGFVNEAGEEVVVINIVGDLDPRALGRVLAHLGGIDFEEIMAGMEGIE